MTKPRIDIIGQNGNTGEHYEEIKDMSDPMSDAKWEEDALAEMIEINQKTGQYKTDEEYYLTKLIDDHWSYNEDLLNKSMPYTNMQWDTDDLLDFVEYAYKSAFKHGFKHCKEYLEENKDDKTS